VKFHVSKVKTRKTSEFTKEEILLIRQSSTVCAVVTLSDFVSSWCSTPLAFLLKQNKRSHSVKLVFRIIMKNKIRVNRLSFLQKKSLYLMKALHETD
jgi:hypothetical protein